MNVTGAACLKFYLLCSMLFDAHYAPNYASIIGSVVLKLILKLCMAIIIIKQRDVTLIASVLPSVSVVKAKVNGQL